MIHHPFFVDPSLSLCGDILVRRAEDTNLPGEPEALAELIRGNRPAPQAHIDAIGEFRSAARLSDRIPTNPATT